MKIPMTTNVKYPKYFVKWEERNSRGTIRSHMRVYKEADNRDELFRALSVDPQVDELYYGYGRPNNTRTMMKVDFIAKHERETDATPTEGEEAGDTE